MERAPGSRGRGRSIVEEVYGWGTSTSRKRMAEMEKRLMTGEESWSKKVIVTQVCS